MFRATELPLLASCVALVLSGWLSPSLWLPAQSNLLQLLLRPEAHVTQWDSVHVAMQLALLSSLAFHLLRDLHRWQMVPVYALAGWLIVWSNLLQPSLTQATSGWVWLCLNIAHTLLVCLTLFLCFVVPLIKLPVPTGPYKVGTVILPLVDLSRDGWLPLLDANDKLYAPNRFGYDKRRVRLQIWYPCEEESVGGRTPATYLEHGALIGGHLAARFSMPAWVNSHLRLADTHAYEGVPMRAVTQEGRNGKEEDQDCDNETHSSVGGSMRHAKAKVRATRQASVEGVDGRGWPVIVFSHGNGGIGAQNTGTCTELASNGYVVCAVDHAFDASAVLYPGHKLMAYDLNLAMMWSRKTAEEMRPIRNDQSELRAGDLSFAIDVLQLIHEGRLASNERLGAAFVSEKQHALLRGSFAGSLDLQRLGVFGHSLGGATVIEAAFRDERIGCVCALDPWAYPVRQSVFEHGLFVPCMIVRGNRFAFPPSWEHNNELLHQLCERTADRIQAQHSHTRVAYDLFVPLFRHHDFHDFKAMAPWVMEKLGGTGPLPGERSFELTNDHVLAFFNKFVRNHHDATVLDAGDAFRRKYYPEVEYRAW